MEDYRAPQWPDSEHPKQFHLDFEVDDIEAEQSRVLALGATLQQDSLGADGYGWRVYTDPVGHPFCLCRNRRAVWTEQGLTWGETQAQADHRSRHLDAPRRARAGTGARQATGRP